MRKFLLIAGMSAVMVMPSIASASIRCERQARDNQVAGTIIGGIAGGFIGNSLSGHNRGAGTAIGAVGGAVIGNRLADASTHCPRGDVAYDDRRGRDDYDRGAPSAYDYGSDTAYSDRYDDNYWRDGRGRACHWQDRVTYGYDGDVRHRWVQACSWR
jgi:uncharacterized protein YcfJ